MQLASQNIQRDLFSISHVKLQLFCNTFYVVIITSLKHCTTVCYKTDWIDFISATVGKFVYF